jgi:hypothetical protein
MTLAEKMTTRDRRPCDIRSECSVEAIKAIVAGIRAKGDEIVVFRRNPETGRYDMTTACCEAVLPTVS